MPKTLKQKPGEKKERATDKRKRISNVRQAKQTAFHFTIPILASLLLALVIFFFCKYGFGGHGAGSQLAKLRKAIKEAELAKSAASVASGASSAISGMAEPLASSIAPTLSAESELVAE